MLTVKSISIIRSLAVASLMFLAWVSSAQALIEGRVTDSANGEGLPGATIKLKSGSTGTVTDVEGRFSFYIEKGEVLIVSYVGYVTQEIPVGSSTQYTIKLDLDVETLEEVVVIGYGTQRKSDITGSVASINTRDMNPGPVATLSNLMQSAAPGVVLTQTSAQPGGGFDVKIRGASSVLGANGPLYVIDGLPITSDNAQPGSSSRYRSSPPTNPLVGINPQDIVSIDILKDASATAIYGARGANGVILITTKRGSNQKLKLDYTSSFSLMHLNREYDMLNGSEFARVSNQVALLRDPTSNPPFSAADVNRAGEGTNWIDQITRLGSVLQQQVGGSGGYKNLKYYVSANYFRQRGIIDVSELERFGGRANLDYSNDKINAGISATFSRTNNQQIAFGANSNAPEFGGLFDNTRNWSPLLPVRDDQGNFSVHPTRALIPNPVSLFNIDDRIESNRLLGTAFFEYEVLTGLKAKINVGRDQQRSVREGVIPLSVIRGQLANGEGEVAETDTWTSLADFTLSYAKEFENKSRIDVVGGTGFQQIDTESISHFFVGFGDQGTDLSQITNADTLNVFQLKERSRIFSFFGRSNFSINDRYLFTFTFRADGSTKFGPNNKWGYFPSGAIAWKIHNEQFFNSSFIDELRLRASYGQIGNQEIGNKLSQSLYNVTRRTIIGTEPIQGLAALRPDNPDLKWETTTQLNLGVDYAILDGRIYGTLDVYESLTDDVLLNFFLPGTAGFDVVTVNSGRIRNRGIEFALTSRNMIGDFQWTSSFNIAFNDNEWRDRAGFYPIGQEVEEENGPLSGVYGYRVLGFFQSQDDIDNSPDQSAVAVAVPGTFKYEDANNDGVITPDDRVLLGQTDPRYTFGINNTFNYKFFDLNFFFQGSMDRVKRNFTRAYIEDVDDIVEGFNKSRAVLDMWTPSNPGGSVPASDNIIGGFSTNDRYIENASFVRLRNITLGYTFRKQTFLSDFRLYCDVQNLITITPFDGNDPETNEFSQYPNAKTYTIGLNASF